MGPGFRPPPDGYMCCRTREMRTTNAAHLLERSDPQMGIGVSLFLLAVGAILTFAVHVSNTGGFDINTIGVILMVVGALGLIVSMIFWGSWNRRSDTVVREREVI